MTPTPLERAILDRYHMAFADAGFPSPDEIEVVGRENSGAGRFVTLRCARVTTIADRTLDLPSGEPNRVRMDGVEHGLGFVLFMDNGKLDFLELYTFAGSWDGDERSWELVAP